MKSSPSQSFNSWLSRSKRDDAGLPAFVYRIVPLSEIPAKIKASQEVPGAQKEKLTKLAAENPSQPTVIQVASGRLGPLQENPIPLISGCPAGARVVVE